MTDIQGNSDATQAARDAAERVRTSADGAESFGATAEQIADEVSGGAEAAASDVAGTVSDIADKVSEKVGDVVDGAKSAAAEARAAAGKAADAAVDAVGFSASGFLVTPAPKSVLSALHRPNIVPDDLRRVTNGRSERQDESSRTSPARWRQREAQVRSHAKCLGRHAYSLVPLGPG